MTTRRRNVAPRSQVALTAFLVVAAICMSLIALFYDPKPSTPDALEAQTPTDASVDRETTGNAGSAEAKPPQRNIGYIGRISSRSQVPLTMREEDFKIVLARDERGMANLAMQERLMLADPGMKCRIIERNWTGLIRVRFQGGRLDGESGWVPYEFVQ